MEGVVCCTPRESCRLTPNPQLTQAYLESAPEAQLHAPVPLTLPLLCHPM